MPKLALNVDLAKRSCGAALAEPQAAGVIVVAAWLLLIPDHLLFEVLLEWAVAIAVVPSVAVAIRRMLLPLASFRQHLRSNLLLVVVHGDGNILIVGLIHTALVVD